MGPRCLAIHLAIALLVGCGRPSGADGSGAVDTGASSGPASTTGPGDEASEATSEASSATDGGADSRAPTSTDSSASDGEGTGPTTSTGADPGCAGFDPNGVTQIYCTQEGKALPWTLGFDDWESRILGFGALSGKNELTLVEDSGQVRMTVTSVVSDCEGIIDHGQALAQGYMCSPDDWLNWEMTGYFQLVVAAVDATDQDWTMYGNGGRHTGDGTTQGCLGSSYKGSYHYADAQVRFAKESWHVHYDQQIWQAVDGGIDYAEQSDAWLGMKVIRFAFERDGEVGVRLEQWLDLGGIDAGGAPANEWMLVNVREDHPGQPSWGSEATYCNAPLDQQIMQWGGPWVTWRWDNTTSRLRLMSVREIVPPEDVPPP